MKNIMCDKELYADLREAKNDPQFNRDIKNFVKASLEVRELNDPSEFL